ncbi:MAG: M35 family metallo-endopeptidase [Bacteroidota bacterium]
MKKRIHILVISLGCLLLFGGLSQPTYVPPLIQGTASHPEVPDSLQNQIYVAHEEAICTMRQILKAYNTLKKENPDSLEQAWNKHTVFPKWLGRMEENKLKPEIVEKRFNILMDWLENDQIIYKVRLGGFSYCNLLHANAYTSQLTKRKVINICPFWFNNRQYQKVSTIIHELVHKMGYGHPKGTVMPSQALVLARTAPLKAAKSPENYEGLAEAYYCYRR